MTGRSAPSGRWWWVRMLAASVGLALGLIFLANMAPGLRLYYYGMRYRAGWGRDEALCAVVRGLSLSASPEVVTRLLGPPARTETDESTVRYTYFCEDEVRWEWTPRVIFSFEGGQLADIDDGGRVCRFHADMLWAEWDAAAGSPNRYRDFYSGPYSRADFPPQADELVGPILNLWDNGNVETGAGRH